MGRKLPPGNLAAKELDGKEPEKRETIRIFPSSLTQGKRKDRRMPDGGNRCRNLAGMRKKMRF